MSSNFASMTRTREKREQMARSLICVGALAVTISVFTPWHAEKMTNICLMDAHGDAVPDRHAEGVLRYFERSYYLERAHADNVVIDRCDKTGCQVPDKSIRQFTGGTAQAEFCGQRLSKLDVSGIAVFQLTQEWLDREYQDSRIATRWTGDISLVIGSLLLFWSRRRGEHRPK
ncbi:hypothetical protein P3T18_000788 [Paraburkholderia sp. GAS199]|uniref:hypothetical protein n=1 Tax=Paraburkholderia sp. GAS199 TaxID=3035126 RepID=UPI003D1EC4A5